MWVEKLYPMFDKVFQLAFQFLDLYLKFMGTILHVNDDFHQLFLLLQTNIAPVVH
jgi:hypothetical protein